MNSHNPLQNAESSLLTRSQPIEQISGLQRSWEQPVVVEKKVECVAKPKRPIGTYRILRRNVKK